MKFCGVVCFGIAIFSCLFLQYLTFNCSFSFSNPSFTIYYFQPQQSIKFILPLQKEETIAIDTIQNIHHRMALLSESKLTLVHGTCISMNILWKGCDGLLICTERKKRRREMFEIQPRCLLTYAYRPVLSGMH